MFSPELVDPQRRLKLKNPYEAWELVEDCLSDPVVREVIRHFKIAHPEHFDHSLRVGALTADFLRSNPEMFPTINIFSAVTAAIGHDIGKIQIPKYVLNNPGNYMDIIKTHPDTGRVIWDDLGYPAAAAVAGGHHYFYPRNPNSNIDYPDDRRDANSEISRLVRMVRAADQIDAMRIRINMPWETVYEILTATPQRNESEFFDEMLKRVNQR